MCDMFITDWYNNDYVTVMLVELFFSRLLTLVSWVLGSIPCLIARVSLEWICGVSSDSYNWNSTVRPILFLRVVVQWTSLRLQESLAHDQNSCAFLAPRKFNTDWYVIERPFQNACYYEEPPLAYILLKTTDCFNAFKNTKLDLEGTLGSRVS